MAIDQVATADGTVRAIFTSQIDDADRHARQFTDGQRAQATSVGDAFAEFMAAARSSIQDAIYNFRLDGAAATKVVGALNRAAQNDIDVEISTFA